MIKIKLLMGAAFALCLEAPAFAAENPWTYDPSNVTINGGTIAGAVVNGVFVPAQSLGQGGDDAPALNTILQNAAAAGNEIDLYLPRTPTGYHVCSAPITMPTGDVAVHIHGVAGGGPAISVLPGCASPPSSVFLVPSGSNDLNTARVTLENLTLDGYCLAAHDVDVEGGAQVTAYNSLFRNVATGGSNIFISAASYNDNFSAGNFVENINDTGHICYTNAAALPSYNLQVNGTDNQFNGLVALNAYIANFYSTAGDQHFDGAHGYGQIPAYEPNGYDLQPQWTFHVAGKAFLDNWVSDSPTVGAVWLSGYNGGLSGSSMVTNGTIINPLSSSLIGVQIDSGVQYEMVSGNTLQAGLSTANGVLQLGTASPTTVVYNNAGASYQAGFALANATLTGTNLNLTSASPAAAGTTLATATVLASAYNNVASGSGGVQLQAVSAVSIPEVIVNGLATNLNLYPPAGTAINSLSNNTALAMLPGQSDYCWPKTSAWSCMAIQSAANVGITGGSVAGVSLGVTPSTPATSSAACTAGQITADANYIYDCTASNTWKRAAVSSF